MQAEKFINEKLGDGNYTHSEFPISRRTLEQWLNEFVEINTNTEKEKEVIKTFQIVFHFNETREFVANVNAKNEEEAQELLKESPFSFTYSDEHGDLIEGNIVKIVSIEKLPFKY